MTTKNDAPMTHSNPKTSLAESLEFYSDRARDEAELETKKITDAIGRMIGSMPIAFAMALQHSSPEGGSYPLRATVGAELQDLRSKIDDIERALARLAVAEGKIDAMRAVAEAAERFAPATK